MNLAIEMTEESDVCGVTDLPAPHMLVVTSELRDFLAQFEDFRLYGAQKSCRTLHHIPLYKNGDRLSMDEWYALRHAVAEYLVGAKSRCHTDNFLVLKPVSHPGLKNTQRKALFSFKEAERLTKKILGSNTTDNARTEFMQKNFFRPQDFFGELNLAEFTP